MAAATWRHGGMAAWRHDGGVRREERRRVEAWPRPSAAQQRPRVPRGVGGRWPCQPRSRCVCATVGMGAYGARVRRQRRLGTPVIGCGEVRFAPRHVERGDAHAHACVCLFGRRRIVVPGVRGVEGYKQRTWDLLELVEVDVVRRDELHISRAGGRAVGGRQRAVGAQRGGARHLGALEQRMHVHVVPRADRTRLCEGKRVPGNRCRASVPRCESFVALWSVRRTRASAEVCGEVCGAAGWRVCGHASLRQRPRPNLRGRVLLLTDAAALQSSLMSVCVLSADSLREVRLRGGQCGERARARVRRGGAGLLSAVRGVSRAKEANNRGESTRERTQGQAGHRQGGNRMRRRRAHLAAPTALW